MRRHHFLLCFAGVCRLAAAPADPASLAMARAHAEKILPLVMAATWPAGLAPSPATAERTSLGAILAHYAANPAGDPPACESLTEAARRILAGRAATKRPPDETIASLDDLADAILIEITKAENSGHAPADPDLAALRARAQLARFHARRLVAAMHYNLFLRGLRLAELVAATYAEKEAVAVWRALTALPASPEIAAARRAELPRLERSLKELEDQCCPPDEAILKEKVWQPVRPAPASAK